MSRNRRTFAARVLILCLALAFVVGANPVFAAGESVTVTPSAASIVNGKLTVPLTVTPTTDFTEKTLDVVLKFTWGGVEVSKVGYTATSHVYADVYGGLLINAVYDGMPAGYGRYGVSVGTPLVSEVGNDISIIVYLTEKSAPPADDEPAPPPPVTTGTDTGWETYQPSTGTSTVYVDPGITEELYADAPETGVVLVTPPKTPAGEVPPNVVASLPLNTVQQGGVATVDSVLQLGNLDVALPPDVMESLAGQVQSGAGSLGSLQVRVQASTPGATQETIGGLASEDQEGKTAASQVITVSFVMVDAQGRETVLSVDKSRLSVNFNPDAVQDPEKVNLYIIGSLIYVGGKVDAKNNQVTGLVSGLKDAKLVALEYSKTFDDIKGHWAQDDIELMASKYVIAGMTKDLYAPEDRITRAQFVTLLVRSLGLAEFAPAGPTFSDVASGEWYYGYVEAAYKAGLASGDAGKGGTFRPDASISREEMSALLVRAMKVYGSPAQAVGDKASEILAGFTDGTAVSDWAKEEVAQSVSEGLIKGHDDGRFEPAGSGIRAQAATMMTRLVRRLGIL